VSQAGGPAHTSSGMAKLLELFLSYILIVMTFLFIHIIRFPSAIAKGRHRKCCIWPYNITQIYDTVILHTIFLTNHVMGL